MAQKRRIFLEYVFGVKARAAERVIARFEKQVKAASRTAQLGSVAIGYGLTRAIGVFSRFEEQLTRTSITMRATAEQTKGLGDEIRRVAKDSPKTASEVAEAANYLAQAGFDYEKTKASLKAVIDLSVVGNLDIAEATDLATDTMVAFGLEAEDLTGIIDGWVRASQLANTNVGQIGRAFKKVAGTAREMGLSVEQTTALITSLSAVLKGEEAGVAANQFLIQLQKNSEELKTLGVNVYDASGKMRDITDVILDYDKALEAAGNDQEKFNKIQALQSVRAMRALLEVTNNTKDGYINYLDEIRKAGGTTAQAIELLAQTEAYRRASVVSSIQELAITFTAVLLPTLFAVYDAVKAGVDAVANWIKENEVLTARIVRITGVALIFLSALWPLIAVFKKVKAAIFGVVVAGKLLTKWLLIRPLIVGVKVALDLMSVSLLRAGTAKRIAAAAARAYAATLWLIASPVRLVKLGVGFLAIALIKLGTGFNIAAIAGRLFGAGLYIALGPIGLLLGGIAALVAFWPQLADWFAKTYDKFEWLKKSVEGVAKAWSWLKDTIWGEDPAEQPAGETGEDDEVIEQNQVIRQQIDQLQEEGASLADIAENEDLPPEVRQAAAMEILRTEIAEQGNTDRTNLEEESAAERAARLEKERKAELKKFKEQDRNLFALRENAYAGELDQDKRAKIRQLKLLGGFMNAEARMKIKEALAAQVAAPAQAYRDTVAFLSGAVPPPGPQIAGAAAAAITAVQAAKSVRGWLTGANVKVPGLRQGGFVGGKMVEGLHGLAQVSAAGVGDTIPALLSPGELVIPAGQTANEVLAAVREQGGGEREPIVVNVQIDGDTIARAVVEREAEEGLI